MTSIGMESVPRGLRSLVRRLPIQVLVLAAALPAIAGTVTLDVGGTSATFETTYCNSEPRQSGQLAIEGEVTAVGTFGGEPAVLFFAKSVPVSGGRGFQEADLALMSAPNEVTNTPPIRAFADYLQEINLRFAEMEKEAMAEISKEKMEGLSPDEITAKFEEFQKKSDAIRKEREAAQPPHARIFGKVTVDGSTVTLAEGEFRPIGHRDHPAFAGVSGTARIVANCED